jgi:hypothetical protein
MALQAFSEEGRRWRENRVLFRSKGQAFMMRLILKGLVRGRFRTKSLDLLSLRGEIKILVARGSANPKGWSLLFPGPH